MCVWGGGGGGYRFTLKGDTFPLRTTSLLERSFGLQEAYTKICSYSAIFLPQHCSTMTWHPYQVSWFSDVFWIYKNFKTKFLNVLGRATMPRCLIFIPISCMGPRNSPKDTHLIFQNFGALENVLVVQIWIMHIKCPETQLMHKNAKRTRNNSKFKYDTHVLVACSLYVNVLAIQTPSFPSVTPFCLSKHNEKKSGIPQTVY